MTEFEMYETSCDDDQFGDVYCPKEDPLYLGGSPIPMPDGTTWGIAPPASLPPTIKLEAADSPSPQPGPSQNSAWLSAPYSSPLSSPVPRQQPRESSPMPGEEWRARLRQYAASGRWPVTRGRQPGPQHGHWTEEMLRLTKCPRHMTRLRQALGCITEASCECGYHEVTVRKPSLKAAAKEEDCSGPASRASDANARSGDADGASNERAAGSDQTTLLLSAKLEEQWQRSSEAVQHHEVRQVDAVIDSPSVKTEHITAEDATSQCADHFPQQETLLWERSDPEPVRAAEHAPAPTSVVLLLLPPDAMTRRRCPVGGQSVSSQASLSARCRSHARVRRLPVCDVCGKVFVDDASASRHRLWHARQVKPRDRYMCDYCGKLYASWASLSGHYSRMHATSNARKLIMPKKYRCDNCGRRFRTRDDLARHSRFEAGVLYGCEICGQSCSDELGLGRHRRTHATRGPYPCGVCKNVFGTVSDLSQHYRQHPGPKSIVCEVCGEAFLEKSHRTEHYRIHIDDRPFKCDVCGKAFRLRRQRTRHQGSHDGAAPR